MLGGHPLRVCTRTAHELVDTRSATADAQALSDFAQPTKSCTNLHMTPPTTPNGSQEDLSESAPPPVFHNFLRAFHRFQPDDHTSDSSVTLPLKKGDVILIHSVHTNGWADGSLLASGSRGWLPTNYCEAYEPDEMRSLLKALLNLWDLLRSPSVNDHEVFRNQEFMKGIFAGVRHLLERTDCLLKDSAAVQRSDILRKERKSLLAELSSFFKAGKRLQQSQNDQPHLVEDPNDIVDEMLLRAFKIVTKGVIFLDVLEEERQARASTAVTIMATVAEEGGVPPTPPAERTTFDNDKYGDFDRASELGSRTGIGASASVSDSSATPRTSLGQWNKRGSSLGSHKNYGASTASSQNRNSQGSLHSRRASSGLAHRVSLAGPSPLSRPQHLVSERLNRSHDKFLSYLGSFIGRLYLQSQSRPELAWAIKQSATSGGELLAVIDSFGAYNSSAFAAMSKARTALFECIQDLVQTAHDTLVNTVTEEADPIMPQDTGILLMAATVCVRVAGECVARTKAAIERLGDFELELGNVSLQIDLTILDVVDDRSRTPSISEQVASVASTAESSQSSQTQQMSSAVVTKRSKTSSVEKPLPLVPRLSIPSGDNARRSASPASSRQSSAYDENAPGNFFPESQQPAMPPLPKHSTAAGHHDKSRRQDFSGVEQDSQAVRCDSLVASSPGSGGTYLSRDSEMSTVSQTSTRASTPDHYLAPRTRPSISDLSAAGSFSQTEDQDDFENRLLVKTFAHELTFSPEGQVTGGTLPALVERLTAHESTPDITFVSTFFLTFRLFCTPVKLTETLIERFDYVGEFPHMAAPVRLRVYNVFKGWLESHWRDQPDRKALMLIIPFADLKLASVLPTAGRRLLELAQRVTADGSLVPRLISSMGKTNTAIAQSAPADVPLPQPCISKSQQNSLTSFRTGGIGPTILDLDPLEIARQLTIKQMSIFSSIMPEELLASQWMKNGGIESPNVKAIMALSTDISNLVAETILHYPEVKKRAAVIKQWIKIAQHCLDLHNYDGLTAIICILNSTTIIRLRKTWDAISAKRKAVLRSLQEIVEPALNCKILRARLRNHVPPCLPFLGMYLTDLTFNDVGNSATKQMSLGNDYSLDGSGGLTIINFDKHVRTAKIIGELQRFQIPFRLIEVHDMQYWISAQIRRVRESELGGSQVEYFRKSLLLEPREPRERSARKESSEPPTPVSSSTNASRGDLFGWMTRDRSQTATPAQG